MKSFRVGACLRVSKDDGKDINSNSIENQKEIIEQYIKKQSNMKLAQYYIDDGYSGTNFYRPGFKQMLLDIKEKRIDAIIVKDLSRFGRNHIQVDNFIENIFPMMNIRFICIIEDSIIKHIQEIWYREKRNLKTTEHIN